MKFSLLSGLLALIVCAQGAVAAPASAFPEKPITIVVPFAAGSPTDAVARVLSDSLSKRLGQPLIVQNRPGATGMIGSEYVARAQPDGYTLLFGTNTTQVANKYFFKNVSYDGLKDFAPVAIVGGVPHALVVNPSVPVSSVAELIAYAKANPGKLSFPYANSTTRITGSTFRAMTHTDISEIPYKAYGQAVSELLGGQTQMMFIDFSTGLAYMTSGKLKPLAITPARSDKLPDVPAMKEALPGFEIGNWNGLFAPKGTPPEIIDKLNREITGALEQPEVRKQIDGTGYELLPPMAPQAFGKYIAEESAHYGKLTQAAGIKPE
ncbi:Bug family tripartite tricarboxylate transporter substrate binding protein [Achromobacter pulmonis]|uniref:Bug family tripartite tricarboxylate transporter substrate binding protein n=1 Tax=Achromobacter pulmonis TaxID=1389932 RepID=UPI001F197D33|nr:tripartite tricarboxylate transporter substrate binding protein [Achromobacter pulmonis]MCF7768970.1 tripartite tricarboxylate transporter substrate binding protein [Achromobacter pulmonis]